MAIDFGSLKDSLIATAQSGIAKAKEFTDTGVTKAKELSEVGKLKWQNSVEQDAIRKAYAELGKLYYAERGSAPEAPYADQCQLITDALARISYNNERIADLKAAGNAEDEDVVDVPVEEAPAEEAAPAEETPAEDAPAAEEAPAAEAPTEEAPAPEEPKPEE